MNKKYLEDEVDALDTIAKAHEWRHKKLGIAASVQQTNEDDTISAPASKIIF